MTFFRDAFTCETPLYRSFATPSWMSEMMPPSPIRIARCATGCAKTPRRHSRRAYRLTEQSQPS